MVLPYIVFGQKFCSNLPLIVLYAANEGPITETSLDWMTKGVAIIQVFTNENGEENCLSDTPIYSGDVALKIRGRSTLSIIKHQFGLYTYGKMTLQEKNLAYNAEFPKKKSISLLGLPKGHTWVLNAPFIDESYIRNAVGYKLAKIGIREWQPHSVFFELFIKTGEVSAGGVGPSDYQGIYLLIEKIYEDNDRVDIAKLSKSDMTAPAITGGYIFARDEPGLGELTFDGGNLGQQLIMVDPDWEDLTAQQTEYFQKALNHLLNGLSGYRCANKVFGQKISQCPGETVNDISFWDVLDVESWIDYFLHTELVVNPDGYANSRYYFKDQDTGTTDSDFGRFHSGPVWDLNLCFDQVLHSFNSWLYVFNGDYAYQKLINEHAEFARGVVHRWFSLRSDVWSPGAITNIFEEQKKLIYYEDDYTNSPVYRDHTKWPRGLTMENTLITSLTVVSNHLSDRTSWIDENICGLLHDSSVECSKDEDCLHGMCRCQKCLCFLGWEGASCNGEIAVKFTILSPTTTSEWTIGMEQKITWSVGLADKNRHLFVLPEELVPNVDIHLVKDRDEYKVTTSTKNDKSYSWIVDKKITPGSGYRIRIQKAESSFKSFSLPFIIHGSEDRSISITSAPTQGGYQANSEISITWTTTGEINDVDIYYSDINDNETPIGSSSNDEKKKWLIPGSLSGTYRIIIREKISHFIQRSPVAATSEPFNIFPWNRPSFVVGGIAAEAPKKGNVFETGEEMEFIWKFASSTTISVNIIAYRGSWDNPLPLLKDDGDVGSKIFLARGLPNDGSITLHLGPIWLPGDDYMFRIEDTGTPPQFDDLGPIEISEVERNLEILSPGKGAVWKAGGKATILWSQMNLKDYKVDLVYSTPDMTTPGIIKLETKNDGSTTWDIPKDLAVRKDYRVLIYCSAADLQAESELLSINRLNVVEGVETNVSETWVYALFGVFGGLLCIASQVFIYFRYLKVDVSVTGSLGMTNTQSLTQKLLASEPGAGNIS